MTPSSRDAVQFTRESAERIANVVRAAELAPTTTRPLRFDPIVQGTSAQPFRLATYTGSWLIGAANTVTFANQTMTPNTVLASNYFFDLPDSGFAEYCAIARQKDEWVLVSAAEPSPVKMATFTGSWSINGTNTVTLRGSTATLSAVNLFFPIPEDGTKNCAIAKDGTAWHLVQWQWAIATCSTATSQ